MGHRPRSLAKTLTVWETFLVQLEQTNLLARRAPNCDAPPRGRLLTINYQLSAINYQVTSLEKGLRDFAQFAAKLRGDEKSEAQTFLFHLLAAFGHDANTLPEGSTFEYRVRFPGERTRCAGFVWPGRCLAISLKPCRDC